MNQVFFVKQSQNTPIRTLVVSKISLVICCKQNALVNARVKSVLFLNLRACRYNCMLGASKAFSTAQSEALCVIKFVVTNLPVKYEL